ncbi:MAG: hydrogenase expression/formation protein HypE [Archangiaceae bacterium]|nr:hydrogenase expression/formation protein HypE [Archangiaceae bacterium]
MRTRNPFPKKLDLTGRVELTHGTGGKVMAQLVEQLFAAAFDNRYLAQRNDQAVVEPPVGKLVMTTDGYVVSPIFFAGGNIGSLAVHGTINDIAMAGARPLYLSSAFILEEGFPLADLKRVVDAMAKAAMQAGVPIVTGDTKVVERGKGDGVFITTTGVGVIPVGVTAPSGDRAKPGDVVLVSGSMGDHGVAILSQREGLSFETTIESDSASLHTLVADMVTVCPDIHVLRDPTRGGLATTLNEIAWQSGVGFKLEERAIPVKPQVAAACELLGIDPLYVANEGKLLAIVAPHDADKVLAAMKAHPLGRDSARVGTVIEDENGFVQLETSFGGSRILDWLAGEQLPRIC